MDMLKKWRARVKTTCISVSIDTKISVEQKPISERNMIMSRSHFGQTTAIILFASILMSCGGNGGNGGNGGSGKETSDMGGQSQEITETDVTGEYAYPDKDYGGYEFRILNFNEFWSCYVRVDIQEQTGEVVDDAVWKRNRGIEDRFGIKISEITEEFNGGGNSTGVTKLLSSAVMAGDDAYDAAFLPISYGPGVITEGNLVDLASIPEINLDKDWWDNVLNSEMWLNGKLYAAATPLQLTSLDLTWVLLFNKDILSAYDLEYPYDTVREGKWTMDELNGYLTKIANLNGDDSFKYSENGNAVYGIAGHDTGSYMFLVGGGERFIGHDDTGKLVYESPDDRFYEVISKVATIFSTSDGKVLVNSMDLLTDAGGYYNLFYTGRAGFLTTELKGAKVMRSLETDYGILPSPKYDENQQDYITYASENIVRCTVPVTVTDLSRTGVILDALSYESYRDVLPLYYGQTISQKGLRDEDSIEMLNIINDTRVSESGLIFGVTSSLVDSLKNSIKNEKDDFASVVAKNEESVRKKLTKLLESIG